ncbi:MAG: hypothetical protein KTR32_06955 [Granulosicoccus sp.]|nr:hypothetical protein [Granulosicoccus sp.]
MNTLILVVGSLILLAGVLLLINQEIIFGFLRTYSEYPLVHVVAVVVRLLIGALLVMYSGESKFPVAIEVLGWIIIAAGIVLAVMGRANFRKLLHWVLIHLAPYGRIFGVVAFIFGGFLVYAFL